MRGAGGGWFRAARDTLALPRYPQAVHIAPVHTICYHRTGTQGTADLPTEQHGSRVPTPREDASIGKG